MALEQIISTRFGDLSLTKLGKVQVKYKQTGTFSTFTVHACKVDVKTSNLALVVTMTREDDKEASPDELSLNELAWDSLHLKSCKDLTNIKKLLPVNWDLLEEKEKQLLNPDAVPEEVWITYIQGLQTARSRSYKLRDSQKLTHVITLETRAANVTNGHGLQKEYEADLILNFSLNVTIKKL